MRVVFLDCDGVMNGIRRWPPNAGRYWIDPEAVERLNRLTRPVNARIVITSTWRRFCDVPALLKAAGVEADVAGQTVFIPNAERGDEIAEWLQHCAVEGFVILDDDSDMGNFTAFHVLTDFGVGLQDPDVDKALEILRW